MERQLVVLGINQPSIRFVNGLHLTSQVADNGYYCYLHNTCQDFGIHACVYGNVPNKFINCLNKI